MNNIKDHFCNDPNKFPIDKYHQIGKGAGKKILIVGESPAENGWRKSDRAFYKPNGKILASGRRLNQLLEPFELSVDICGFTELSKCFIGKDRNLLKACCKGCWPIFINQVKSQNYRLVIILGVKTLEIFSELIGKKLAIGKLSEVKIGNKKYLVLGIYHPSPINPFGFAKNKKIFEQKEIQQII